MSHLKVFTLYYIYWLPSPVKLGSLMRMYHTCMTHFPSLYGTNGQFVFVCPDTLVAVMVHDYCLAGGIFNIDFGIPLNFMIEWITRVFYSPLVAGYCCFDAINQ